MIGQIAAVQGDQKAVWVLFHQPVNFKLNEPVNVSRKKPLRSLKQNSFYWSFLTWCISRKGGNLEEQGHFSPAGLHEDVKSWVKSTHGVEFRGDFSTAELNRSDFRLFFDYLNLELMNEFFGIDTSGFFADYEAFKAEQEHEPEMSFREFMDSRGS